MFTFLTLLLALISIMFVTSMISAVAEMRREDEEFKDTVRRNRAF
ncbi:MULTISPECIES: hypothetical protein [unclassified Rhizobium]|nr:MULTISPECIES: hypothetical protein [unclassified Rhizobium]MDH7800980.1 hypothetical protein [Rhizobium sp. AN70]